MASLDELIERVRAFVPPESPPASRSLTASHAVANARGSDPATAFFRERLAASAGALSPAWFVLFSDTDFVRMAYQHLLGRLPDADGLDTYAAYLRAGGSRTAVLASLAAAPEALRVARTLQLTPALRRLLTLERLGRRLRCLKLASTPLRLLEQGWRLDALVQLQQDLQHMTLRPQAADAVATPDQLDAYYHAFEAANRGSEAEVSAKLAPYADWITRVGHLPGPVLDLGCGRGEWLHKLQVQGVTARGVDTSPVMVNTAQAAGLSVQWRDALTALRETADSTLAGVTAFHLIEHLPFEVLYALVAELPRVLLPGGLVLFETPNPENPLVGSHTFYHDFTHRNPVTPTAISFLLTYHGLEVVQIRRLNPYPPEARVPGNDPLTERVNGMLCGPQDFAVIARRPEFAPQP